jgi:uracil-DNA glycosylase family 4
VSSAGSPDRADRTRRRDTPDRRDGQVGRAEAGGLDPLADFLATFRTYLAQQQEAGVRWYWDTGSVRSPEASMTPEQPQPRPVAPAAGPDNAPAAAGASCAAACAAVVRDTVARIARHREAIPAQGDIFTARAEPVPVLEPAEKETVLAALAAEVAACRLCQLHATRTQTVFGAGNPDANLLLIGEAPGREEDRQGLPFVGRSGQLLTEILKAIGFARDDVYICNILKCRPPDNRDPGPEEVRSCEAYLQRQLEVIEPRVILCLGRVAAHTLLGTRAALGALRESVHFYAGIPVMVTFHPAALLRNPHLKRPCWDDVRRVRALHDALQ